MSLQAIGELLQMGPSPYFVIATFGTILIGFIIILVYLRYNTTVNPVFQLLYALLLFGVIAIMSASVIVLKERREMIKTGEGIDKCPGGQKLAYSYMVPMLVCRDYKPVELDVKDLTAEYVNEEVHPFDRFPHNVFRMYLDGDRS